MDVEPSDGGRGGGLGARTPAGVCLLVDAGVWRCALPLAHVVETMRPLEVGPLVGAADIVVGVSLIRGLATPVLDLARLLGRFGDRAWGRFVTLRAGERTVALAVGAVAGVEVLARASLEALPPLLRAAGPGVVETLGTLDGALLVVLDGARLVSVSDAPAVEGSGP